MISIEITVTNSSPDTKLLIDKPFMNILGCDTVAARLPETISDGEINNIQTSFSRIKRNLGLTDDVVEWCRKKIMNKSAVIKHQGKNWHIKTDDCIITVNASSYTVITAHKEKR